MSVYDCLDQSSEFLYCMTHRALTYMVRMIERDNGIKININANGLVL